MGIKTSHRVVVSYRNSTSNHNKHSLLPKLSMVVSYRNSTSNHNPDVVVEPSDLLYLIEILHQTTTVVIPPQILHSCILSKFYIKPQHGGPAFSRPVRCILSKFYIKPQLRYNPQIVANRCILSKFYIKPQHGWVDTGEYVVVSYRNSTSNHNTPLLFSV